jgi:hypothetical protein
MLFVGYLKPEFIDKKIATKMSTVDGRGERAGLRYRTGGLCVRT